MRCAYDAARRFGFELRQGRVRRVGYDNADISILKHRNVVGRVAKRNRVLRPIGARNQAHLINFVAPERECQKTPALLRSHTVFGQSGKKSILLR